MHAAMLQWEMKMIVQKSPSSEQTQHTKVCGLHAIHANYLYLGGKVPISQQINRSFDIALPVLVELDIPLFFYPAVLLSVFRCQ